MVERKDGLIVNVSSPGGLRYLFNVVYGVGKAAVDRMAADCAVELKKDNVTMISLWPGPVKTEYVEDKGLGKNAEGTDPFANAETVEFAGKAIANLAADANKMGKTGKIVLVCDLAKEYGFTDVDGDIHDFRSITNMLTTRGHTWLGACVPSFVRLPLFVLHYATNKF
jgi:dehydrogenase/reductase SDR family protein 1